MTTNEGRGGYQPENPAPLEAELPESFCRGMPQLTLQSGEVTIDCVGMEPGSFPREYLQHVGLKRFRATLDVVVHRAELRQTLQCRESVRLVATGRITLEDPHAHPQIQHPS